MIKEETMCYKTYWTQETLQAFEHDLQKNLKNKNPEILPPPHLIWMPVQKFKMYITILQREFPKKGCIKKLAEYISNGVDCGADLFNIVDDRIELIKVVVKTNNNYEKEMEIYNKAREIYELYFRKAQLYIETDDTVLKESQDAFKKSIEDCNL